MGGLQAPDAGTCRRRDVVERCINRVKPIRATATRCGERAAFFGSEVLSACIVLHLR